ncbi:tRNA-dihydrouridine synthase family protein [uncultured Desulfosarcina sp.]|uniref:tRNA dihydrouridine synthase n=1 Tax=uncultured Desulfosarcina sp. TaxID=218289 RepID=UPI0029C63F66|nr:tRNA-dihydrouridine synthase family protein [uncultured Desulfosarcina sp.]
MKSLVMAPLRGLTDAVFRNAYQKHFSGVDEAVAPFVTSLKGRRIKPSHLRDLSPDRNRNLPVVPQILSNDADEFIRLANTLMDMGYSEVNWNLGCPYPMVAKKMRGSGLLPHADIIDRLLDNILNGFHGQLSIKTRLGRFCTDEMDRLVPVFNRYPLVRLIVHPRTGVQMYTGTVNLDAFAMCLAQIDHPVVYNGDIREPEAFVKLAARFPGVDQWMLGRGLIADPFLPEKIRTGSLEIHRRRERFAGFHDDLLAGYLAIFSGPGHVLDRMKGLWGYFADDFEDSDRLLKRIRKARNLDRYRQLVDRALMPS